ncbi:UDP-glucuronosyl/UDP-glucosyltransferase [Corchorus olitorius]|uniref:UDP-glucuronosyl/UDP-glucosyltransferase n=1 Tax=Corchorus olitorius TaxID=93759 RepID=A0A1R3H9E2_9ROSI|nr:UDP-glucuronosyl/UDP-glucosyltransferase [Corchorus olitorius]
MEEAVVLYPTPAIGHVRAMVELGKVILSHQPSLSIHVLIATPPHQADGTAPYITAASSASPGFTFHRLPETTLPPPSSKAAGGHEGPIFEVLHLNNPFIHEALVSISKNSKIQALIMDFFISVAFQVATELNIRPYYLYTNGAGSLASFLYLPTLHNQTTESFKDMDVLLDIPGVPPVPAKDMISPLLDRNQKAYEFFYGCSITMAKSAGIITNTFEALEPRVIKAISDGLCVPDAPTAPLYCIGPLIASTDEKKTGGASGGRMAECLTWLDSQPSKSVVYLCFGSLGLFSKEQLREMALGLERSGQRVLLVEEMKIALPMVELEKGFVSSDEVEKRVRELMKSKEGKVVREQITAMKEAAKAAWGEGGSSHLALAKLVESWKHE